jgi:hypothetical protein
MPESPRISPCPPVPGRVIDALLGGRRNTQADRDLARVLRRQFPGAAQAATEALAFTARAVTWCAEQGIAQFIVPNPFLPLPGGTAEAARAVIPGARVAYASADPSALAYAQAAASRDDLTAVVRGCAAADVAGLLGDPGLLSVIDLGKPVCAVLAMTAHLLPGPQAAAMVAGFAGKLTAGSAIVLSTWVADDEPRAGKLTAVFLPAAQLFRHTVADVEGWLSGLDVVEPGVTDVRSWRPGWAEQRRQAGPAGMTAGVVARVP